jgi:hypothetical protein
VYDSVCGGEIVGEYEAECVADRMGGEGDVGFGARCGRRGVAVSGF